MKRIVCNSNFKKVISYMILIILILENFIPCIVYGANGTSIEVTDEIKKTLDSKIVKWIDDDSTIKTRVQTCAGWLKSMWVEKFPDYIPNNQGDLKKGQEDAFYVDIVANILYANSSNRIERIHKDQGKELYLGIYTTDRKVVYNAFNKFFGQTVASDISGVQSEANGTIKDNEYQYEFFVVKKIKDNSNSSNNNTTYNDKQINDIIKHLTDKDEYLNPDTVRTQLMTDPSKIEAEFDEEGNVKNVTVDSDLEKQWKDGYDYTKDDDDANLGGILLSPVFYLINFIADAVVSNLQRIMTGDGSLLRA